MYDPLLRGLFLKPRFGTATVIAKATFSLTGEKSPSYFSYADIYRKKSSPCSQVFEEWT